MKVQTIFLGLLFIISIFHMGIANAEMTLLNNEKITVDIVQLEEIKNVIKESNTNDFYLFWISIGIAVIAIISIIVSTSFLRKQVKILEQDFETRLDPWLSVQPIFPNQVILETGGSLLWEDFQNSSNEIKNLANTVNLRFPVKNVGGGIARDIKKIVIIDNKEFSKEKFEEMQEKDVHMVYPPNETANNDIGILWNQLPQTPTDELFVGISLSYAGILKRKYSGAIYKITGGRSSVIDSWAV